QGRIDFALLLWADGKPRVRLVECKASRRDQMHHRVQVAIYYLLARQLLVGDAFVPIEDVECVVARIDEDTSQSQDILLLQPLDLSLLSRDVERLLSVDGTLWQVAHSELDALEYRIDGKCDGCVFNVHC